MDLSAMWAKAQGDRQLPARYAPEGGCSCAGPDGPCEACIANREAYEEWLTEPRFSAKEMRDFATPDPEALQRFAEAVAEECAKVCMDDAAGCQRAAEMMVDEEERARYDAMAGVLLEAAAAIRRHVKGE